MTALHTDPHTGIEALYDSLSDEARRLCNRLNSKPGQRDKRGMPSRALTSLQVDVSVLNELESLSLASVTLAGALKLTKTGWRVARIYRNNLPSRQQRRTGYLQDSERHQEARSKVAADRRLAIAKMGAEAARISRQTDKRKA